MLHFLFTSEGRITRSEYWVAYACWFGLGAVIWIPTIVLLIFKLTIMALCAFVLALACSIYSHACTTIKRLHDRNKSGWWSVLSFIPLINLWFLVECGCMRGTRGPNRFGADPLGSSDYGMRAKPSF